MAGIVFFQTIKQSQQHAPISMVNNNEYTSPLLLSPPRPFETSKPFSAKPHQHKNGADIMDTEWALMDQTQANCQYSKTYKHVN